MEGIEGGLMSVEPTQRSVWICPECFDVYDRRPQSGNCPSPGHAPVQLFGTVVRSVASTADTGLAVVADAEDRAPVRPKHPQGGRRRRRADRRRKSKAA